MMSTNDFQPLQLKGEIMDLEFTIDTDHRKRRRNRTTQSCLNCHTSKRKEEALPAMYPAWSDWSCVYEIDDPALRDDPSLDESTRLRNRIAELESLVRELRGKPHPRWAESTFRDGDPNEKWHSRATKCAPLSAKSRPQGGQTQQNSGTDDRSRPNGAHPMLSPIKTEPLGETNAHLYRFSPSPAPSMRYHGTFQTEGRGSDSHSNSSFDDQRSGYPSSTAGPTSANGGYHPNPANGHYSNGAVGPAPPPSYSDGGGGSYSDDGNGSAYDHYHANSCPCRSNPTLAVTYMTLSQTLQNSLSNLRQYTHHPPNAQCSVFRKVIDLNNILHVHDSSPGLVAASYDSGPASDSEIMTPLSASSGPASFHNGSPAVSPQEWNHMANTTAFNPYFPTQDHHSVYHVNHVMS